MNYRNIKRLFFLSLYYGFCRFLPVSFFPIFGSISKKARYYCCKHIFRSCGKNANIERLATFGSGANLEIGDNSGIGINCYVPSNTKIGSNVMMGPNVYILQFNHKFDRTDILIRENGYDAMKQTIIEDDVWIGRQVIFTPGRTVKQGSVIGAGTLLCKDFQEYSIIGGNPSKLIRLRK